MEEQQQDRREKQREHAKAYYERNRPAILEKRKIRYQKQKQEKKVKD